MTCVRVGQGFDIHRFSDDPRRRVVLGGVVFDVGGLHGHSAPDRIAHAVPDALPGAAGPGDSGGAGKTLVAQGQVSGAGTAENRKTAKIRRGQSVTCSGVRILVKSEPASK